MRSVLLIVLAAALTLSCGEDPAGPGDDEELGYNSVLQRLRQDGLAAEPAGPLSQPFLSVPGRLIAVGDEQVQVFEYADERSAQADAARISPDGSKVGNTHVDWFRPVHFYRRGHVLAVYVGDRPDIKTALERLLGPQFAGR
jgi:hypothetical protein